MNRELNDWQASCICEMSLDEYDAEVRRRLRRHRWRVIGEIVGAIAFLALLAAFCLLCCAASGYHWE